MVFIDLRVLADFAAHAVHFKLLDAARVIAWADSMIAGWDGPPPPWLMDLSLVDATDELAVCGALREVPGAASPEESLALLNGLVLREWQGGRLTIGAVRGIGWSLHRSEFEQHDPSRWGVVVECEGELVDDGLISEADMRARIDRELDQFIAQLRGLPEWV